MCVCMREGMKYPSVLPFRSADCLAHPIPQDYYFYLTSNRHGIDNVHLDPSSYLKISNLKAEYDLPERIFLDKGNRYTFAIHLTPRAELLDSEWGWWVERWVWQDRP